MQPRSGKQDAEQIRRKQPSASLSAENIVKAFNTWAFKREQPSDLVLLTSTVEGRLLLSQPIAFVLYWGKGPRDRAGRPEVACLDFIASLAHRIQAQYHQGACVELIFTDTHARLNGHSSASIAAYYESVADLARQRSFMTSMLSGIVDRFDEECRDQDRPRTDLIASLTRSASRWYNGSMSAEQAASTYFSINMTEKRAVEEAFPDSIFVTFNNSRMRELLPNGMPIFYMYSTRKGVAVKPWFMAETEQMSDNPSTIVDI